MELIKRLRSLERKYPWSILGFVLTLLIYFSAGYLKDNRARLYIDIETDTAVVDIKEEIPNLRILYNDVDIRKKKLSLRILKLKIINDSGTDILKTFYDPKAPVSLSIDSGRIVSAELIEAGNEYLKKNFMLRKINNKELYFNDVIFDAESFVLIKLLVLHSDKSLPKIITGGHIAGITSIPVRDYSKIKDRRSWTEKIFEGIFSIVRAIIIITFGIIALALLIGLPMNFIGNRKKKRLVKEYRNYVDFELSNIDEALLSEFEDQGERHIYGINHLISNEDLLNNVCTEYTRQTQRFEAGVNGENLPKLIKTDGDDIPNVRAQTIRVLIKNNIITKSGERWILNPSAEYSINKLTNYLKAKGLMKDIELSNDDII